MITAIAKTRTSTSTSNDLPQAKFNTKMKRIVKSRKGTLKGLSANDFLEVDSKDIANLFRQAIRDYGLRINGRVKSARPGRKGAYINNYAV